MKRNLGSPLIGSLVVLAGLFGTTLQSASASTMLVPVVVAKETDGDTVHVAMPNGQDETIRMLLIDTPEDVKPGTPVEPFSLQAAAFARKELPVGKHIFIEEGKPGHTRDKYGRLLAFVYVKKTDMYNEDVVKRGLARVAYIYPPNTQHLSVLKQDQAYAERHHLGIWTIPGYVTPDGYNMNAVKKSNSGSSNKSSSLTKSSFTSTSGLSIVSFTQHASPGDDATIEIHAKPGAQATIEVDYKSGPSHAQGLYPQTANSSGDVTWTWLVGTRTTPGNWPVIITSNGKTLQTTLDVQ